MSTFDYTARTPYPDQLSEQQYWGGVLTKRPYRGGDDEDFRFFDMEDGLMYNGVPIRHRVRTLNDKRKAEELRNYGFDLPTYGAGAGLHCGGATEFRFTNWLFELAHVAVAQRRLSLPDAFLYALSRNHKLDRQLETIVKKSSDKVLGQFEQVIKDYEARLLAVFQSLGDVSYCRVMGTGGAAAVPLSRLKKALVKLLPEFSYTAQEHYALFVDEPLLTEGRGYFVFDREGTLANTVNRRPITNGGHELERLGSDVRAEYLRQKLRLLAEL